ncbi:hypothetical protein J132_03403 [Termitomyces sp. J132]|nr:hypothetical protein J132_03403 [Termitomyces sp. J132]
MEWTNSVPIFHDKITFILQLEIPHNMLSFINNVGAKGPKDWRIIDGKPAKHPTNPHIHLALWEFFELLNRILQQMKYCGSTFSGHKLVLCTPTFKILGHICTPNITYLAKKYNLHYIQISGYNKCANGIVKQPHFDVCQALFKVVDSDQSRWSTATYSVFWSECVMVHKQMGCSPYYVTTGTHPLLPADIMEVTYLQPLPNSLLLTMDLIAHQVIDLQCCQEDLNCLHSDIFSTCCLAAIHFKAEHAAMIHNYNFQTSDLVLMRNTRIEVTHNKKMKPHYLGPLVVISCNHGSAYILCELDGSVLHCPIAAY